MSDRTASTATAQASVQAQPNDDRAYSHVHTLLTIFKNNNKQLLLFMGWKLAKHKYPAFNTFCDFGVLGVQFAETRTSIGLQLHSHMCAHPCYPCTFTQKSPPLM